MLGQNFRKQGTLNYSSALIQFSSETFNLYKANYLIGRTWAVVVAQLVEGLLPTPEICGLNPDIGKILSTNRTIEKTKIKKKRPGMANLKKI